MEITGESVVRINSNFPEGGGIKHTNHVSGAFAETGMFASMNGGSAMTSSYYGGNFYASRSWTGNTSQPNDLPLVYQDNAKVKPDTLRVNIIIKY